MVANGAARASPAPRAIARHESQGANTRRRDTRVAQAEDAVSELLQVLGPLNLRPWPGPGMANRDEVSRLDVEYQCGNQGKNHWQLEII